MRRALVGVDGRRTASKMHGAARECTNGLIAQTDYITQLDFTFLFPPPQINTSNLERVRRIKNRMVRLTTRVETVSIWQPRAFSGILRDAKGWGCTRAGLATSPQLQM